MHNSIIPVVIFAEYFFFSNLSLIIIYYGKYSKQHTDVYNLNIRHKQTNGTVTPFKIT